ncbi:MAG: hypothetical protein MJ103_04660 [Saccharofermentans sp.]|nr:hypothetical protein [Saccharofermentans sp.]
MNIEDTEEILSGIDYLYGKYGVSKDFYLSLSDEARIKGMKGILADLDRNKTRNYSAEDVELIKDIYFVCC